MNWRIRTALAVGAATLAVIALVGCTSKITNLSLASTANVDLSKKYTLVASNVSAKSSTVSFLLYFGTEDLSYYKALSDCLAEHDGDLMTNVKVTTTSYWLILGFYTDYKVAGDVWKVADGQAELIPEEAYDLLLTRDRPLLVSSDGTDALPAYGMELPPPTITQ